MTAATTLGFETGFCDELLIPKWMNLAYLDSLEDHARRESRESRWVLQLPTASTPREQTERDAFFIDPHVLLRVRVVNTEQPSSWQAAVAEQAAGQSVALACNLPFDSQGSVTSPHLLGVHACVLNDGLKLPLAVHKRLYEHDRGSGRHTVVLHVYPPLRRLHMHDSVHEHLTQRHDLLHLAVFQLLFSYAALRRRFPGCVHGNLAQRIILTYSSSADPTWVKYVLDAPRSQALELHTPVFVAIFGWERAILYPTHPESHEDAARAELQAAVHWLMHHILNPSGAHDPPIAVEKVLSFLEPSRSVDEALQQCMTTIAWKALLQPFAARKDSAQQRPYAVAQWQCQAFRGDVTGVDEVWVEDAHLAASTPVETKLYCREFQAADAASLLYMADEE